MEHGATNAQAERCSEGEPVMKRARVDTSSKWKETVRALIESTDSASLAKLRLDLQKLDRLAYEQQIAQRVATGCGVVLVDSNQSHNHDDGYNGVTRFVEAKFTVGPKRAAFNISVETLDNEGNVTTTVSTKPHIFSVNNSKFKLNEEADLGAFLRAAGLRRATPVGGEDDVLDLRNMVNMDRKRWLIGDIVYEAVELIIDKYKEEDEFGVELGIGSDEVYKWMKLKNS